MNSEKASGKTYFFIIKGRYSEVNVVFEILTVFSEISLSFVKDFPIFCSKNDNITLRNEILASVKLMTVV